MSILLHLSMQGLHLCLGLLRSAQSGVLYHCHHLPLFVALLSLTGLQIYM